MPSHAVRKPDEVLDELGISDPSEIDIEAIAQHCGATIVYEDLTGCAGRILGVGDKAVISIAEDGNTGRKRFSAGHELGHWMYDRGATSYFCRQRELDSAWNQDGPETRANKYAIDLLMPKNMVRSEMRGLPPNFTSVERVASAFRLSLTATAIRFTEVCDHPAMLICHRAEKRGLFRHSTTAPRQAWPLDRPGDSTLAAKLLAGGMGGAPKEVDADEWVRGAGVQRHTVLEDSIRIQDQVLSLIWWQNERALLEAEEEEEEDDPLADAPWNPGKR